MKHRRNKVKREHGIIQDALGWLEELTRHPEVSDVIPGVIEVSRSPGKGIVYKYETQTGCKLLLKSNGSIQEAFVVTKDPAWVRAWVEGRFPQPASGDEKAKRDGLPSREESPGEESPQAGKAERQDNAQGRKDFHRSQGAYPHKGPSRKAQAQAKGQAVERRTAFKQHSSKFHQRKMESVSGRTSERWASAGEMEGVNVSDQINPATARALRTLQKQLKGSKVDKGRGPLSGKKH